jgi:hypothetical protein
VLSKKISAALRSENISMGWNAQNCYMIADTIDVYRFGWGSGGLVAAECIKYVEEVKRSTTVITKEEGLWNSVQYNGDWGELKDWLATEVQKPGFGMLASLELFKLDARKIGSIDELVEQLQQLGKFWAPELKEKLELYRGLRSVLGLEDIFEKENAARLNYLNIIEETIRKALKEKIAAEDRTLDTIMACDNKVDIIPHLKAATEKGIFCGDELGLLFLSLDENDIEDLCLDEFFDIFTNPEKRTEYQAIRSLKPAYLNFNKTFKIGLQTTHQMENDIANQVLFEEGLNILNSIRGMKIQVELKDDELDDYVRIKKELTRDIKQLFAQGKTEEAQEMVKEKKELDQEHKEREQAKVEELLTSLGITRSCMEMGVDQMKEILSQLSQHNLSGKIKLKAQSIASSLVVSDETPVGPELRAYVWDKDVRHMPTYQQYRACTLLGWNDLKDIEIFNYMADPNVQLVKLNAGEKSGLAIVAALKSSAGKTLLVDSVESASHMFSRPEVTAAAVEALQDYARESGFDRILFSTAGNNEAPKEFIRNLEDMKLRKKKFWDARPMTGKRMPKGLEIKRDRTCFVRSLRR